MAEQKTKDLFFDIYSEEIPAGMQRHAGGWAERTIASILEERAITHRDISVCVSPQHLAVSVRAILEQTESFFEEKRGPRVDAKNTAIDGFVRANGADRSELVEKNGHLFLVRQVPSKAFIDLLPGILQAFLARMPWPKTMHWFDPQTGHHSAPWVRPIHSIACLFGTEPVRFALPGIVESTGDITYGHRFLSPESFALTSFEQYKAELAKRSVIVDYSERRQAIHTAAQAAAKERGLELFPANALLDEIAGLVDYPFVIVGRIDSAFMHLPPEVLVTSMRVHQKYLATVNTRGALAPYFISFSNRPEANGSTCIQNGMERVLRARLSDAAFFYKTDLSVPLEARTDRLKATIFHAQLGSMHQKTQRLAQMLPEAQRAAKLSKLDLVSDMVREFEELQGTMGAHYATQQGETPEVAKAIGEQYYPLGQEGSLPETPMGQQLAIADRVDTLVGFLGLHIRPTGSKDPFALRRAALGIIRILIDRPGGDWFAYAERAQQAYAAQGVMLAPDVLAEVRAFLAERLAFYLKDQKALRYDIVQAVLASKDAALQIPDIYQRALALQAFLPTAPGAAVLQLFRRVSGLLGAEEEPSSLPEKWSCAEEEAAATNALQCQKSLKKWMADNDYAAALQALVPLCPPMEAFFTAVQINAENPTIRAQRRALLQHCIGLFRQFADFSCIQE